MILYVQGNLFQSPAQTLVNTVNTVGVMGKGVALEFKRLFPSIAFPPLGCGNSQLDFATQIQPLMARYLKNLPIDVFIYPDQKMAQHHLRKSPHHQERAA